jgi:hypothetical protein
MNETFTLRVELFNGKSVEVDVTCDFIIENNGIGSYEHFGFRGFDRGVDCAVIEGTSWNKTEFTADENDLIDAAVDKNLPIWEDEIVERKSQNNRENVCFGSDED